MCFFDQTRFACGDWVWGNFAAKCNHQYRMGETCRKKSVNVIHHVGFYGICQKIPTKCCQKDYKLEKLARWRREGGVPYTSLKKAKLAVRHLTHEILFLRWQRQERQRVVASQVLPLRGTLSSTVNAPSQTSATADEPKTFTCDSEISVLFRGVHDEGKSLTNTLV